MTSSRDTSDPEIPPADQREPSTSRRILSAILVLFCLWHIAAMGFTMIPAESHLRTRLAPIFDRYRQLVGAEQHWDMFVTIPHHQAYEGTIVATGPGGTSEIFGPILPDLKKAPDYFRFYTFLTRLDLDDFGVYLEPYAAKVGEELKTRSPEATRFEIRKRSARIRKLDTIRDLNEATSDGTTIHGPYPLDPPS